MTAPAAVDTLAAALGPDAVRTSDLAHYEIDGRTPDCVVTPRSPEEVARALAAAGAAGLAVIPVGGGTMLSWGNVPARYDLALDLTALNRVVEYAPEDLTVTVEAGVRLADLNARLAERRQFLPFDPPEAAGATVGGVVAANATGPSRHAYDAPRDRLIGVTAALTDGSLAKAGGRVVKNVAGYDLCKLYCGSMGTLGVIVSMTFKIAPLPRADVTWGAPFASAAEAARAAFAATDRGLALRSLEALSPAAAARLGLERAWTLLARCSGGAAAVERSTAELAKLAPGKAAGADLWRRYAGLTADAPVVLRLSTLPSRTTALLEQLSDRTIASATLAHGLVRVALEEDEPALRGAVERDGAWTFERAPAGLKREMDIWGPLPPAFEVMRRLKREFDPAGTLSPGRFAGRL